jgi:hypothetical protein
MMRRACAGAALAAAVLWAQNTGREDYRAAYQTWRQLEPALELDAATAGAPVAEGAQRAANAADAYTSARAAFLQQSAGPAAQREQWLQNALPESAPLGARGAAAAQTAAQAVTTMIDALAGDTDPAIGRLRQALERERAAVTALTEAIQRRQQAQTAVAEAGAAEEAARQAALAAVRQIAARRAQAADQVRKEGAAWQTYYQLLADGVRGTAVSIAVAPAGPAPAAPPPAKPAAPKSITPLPLARYVGGWSYPANGVYKGAQPEFADMVVYEQNGHVTGTLYARFVLPPGSPGDPVLRFEFEGDLQPQRNQVFPLRTTEGATGTIELIPGPAFNLLEINFQTTPVENKVRNGNFLLLKK